MRFTASPRTAIAASLVLAAMVGCGGMAAPRSPPPRLVVMLAIDQFGAAHLARLDSFATGGFRRAIDQGMWFGNAWVDHAPTNSLPGHVTLATGLTPAHHGIVGNSWVETGDGGPHLVSPMADSTEHLIGDGDGPGVSPRRMLRDGLASWIRAADSSARVVGIGSGRISSMLHIGRVRPAIVYWYEAGLGRYATSSYYRGDDPDWIVRFNQDSLPRYIGDSIWVRTVSDVLTRRFARPDSVGYEADGVHVTFPHRFREEADTARGQTALASWFQGTPAMDEATLALATTAVARLRLGQENRTDYLAIVLSTVDGVGHHYGPRSVEMLDDLTRLDRALATFLDRLDALVGPGRWVLALSADHGSVEAPEYRLAQGLAGMRVPRESVQALMDRVNDSAATWRRAGHDDIADRVAGLVRGAGWVEGAFAGARLTPGTSIPGVPDSIAALFRASHRVDRRIDFPIYDLRTGLGLGAYDVIPWLPPGTMPDFATAIHGSPHPYDRAIPIVLLGAGVPQGRSAERASTRDVAPSLAALAGIPTPGDLDGRPLLEPR